jgi:hypothetical protein
MTTPAIRAQQYAQLAEEWMALEPSNPMQFGKAIENARCLAIIAAWITFARTNGASDETIRLLAKAGAEMADKPLDSVT